MSDTSILEDSTNYIAQYSEQTKYSCIILGIALLLIILFFIGPFALSPGSFSSIIAKLVIVGLLVATSTILFKAVVPVFDAKGILETDLFPDLKNNFFITISFIGLIAILGIVVIRL
jgi:hypothetical protein